jgi:hypothetical protein
MARGKRRRRSDSEISEDFSQTRTKMQNIIQRLRKATQRTEEQEDQASSSSSDSEDYGEETENHADDVEVVADRTSKLVDKEGEEDNPEDRCDYYSVGSYICCGRVSGGLVRGTDPRQEERGECSASRGLRLHQFHAASREGH